MKHWHSTVIIELSPSFRLLSHQLSWFQTKPQEGGGGSSQASVPVPACRVWTDPGPDTDVWRKTTWTFKEPQVHICQSCQSQWHKHKSFVSLRVCLGNNRAPVQFLPQKYVYSKYYTSQLSLDTKSWHQLWVLNIYSGVWFTKNDSNCTFLV